MSNTDRLVWVDIETTGLDEYKGDILELGLCVTDSDFVVYDRAAWIIALTDETLIALDPFILNMHGKNGLLGAARRSNQYMQDINDDARVWLNARAGADAGTVPMAGSNIANFDRRWMRYHLPNVESWFHYRNVDVSTVKNLVRFWYPGLPKQEGRELHRVTPDIEDSIAELAFYRKVIFKEQASWGFPSPRD